MPPVILAQPGGFFAGYPSCTYNTLKEWNGNEEERNLKELKKEEGNGRKEGKRNGMNA